ncbi:hypothetical protein [Candidatus Entotheonella palauensis]|uniref:hypothetical protein n=1 Tax=Candidatus Entotheonella palauensis TaxID=93172 RepID=UPI0004AEAF3D|nr:hypothetical protein [Candidatus Entotheonella palauensis]
MIAYFYHPNDVSGGNLIGSDPYYWMVVFRDLVESGEWFNLVIERSNAPYGESWFRTHPFLLLLLLVYAPLRLFLETPVAIHYSAIVLPPLLHLMTAVVGMWASAPLLGRQKYWVVPVLAFQFPILIQGVPGRADHHLVMLMIFLLTLGCCLRVLLAEKKVRAAFWAGMLAGLGLWISVEMMLGLALAYSVMGLFWLFSEVCRLDGPSVLRANLALCVGVVLSLGIAVLLEYPLGQHLTPEYDRVSVVYLVMTLLALCVWGGIFLCVRGGANMSRPAIRLLLLGGGVMAALAALALAYPDFYQGPLGRNDDQEMLHLLNEATGEMVAAHKSSLNWWLATLIPPLIGVGLVRWAMAREQAVPKKLGWAGLAAILVMFVLLVFFYKIRFWVYSTALTALLVAGFVGWVVDYSHQHMRHLTGALVRIPTILIAILGSLALLAAPSGSKMSVDTAGCKTIDIAPSLNQFQEEAIVFSALLFDGPELLYRTPHAVLGTPYHRNKQGIIDTFRAMRSPASGAIPAMIVERGIDYILVCKTGDPSRFLAAPIDAGSLYTHLVTGQPPPWLQPVPLTEPRARNYALYKVNIDASH